MLNETVRKVTDGIVRRSEKNRQRLSHPSRRGAGEAAPSRHRLPCSNLAHGMAVCTDEGGAVMRQADSPAIAIFTSYNDVLSAHHTYEHYPALLKEEVAAAGGVAQVAGGVPAMCDGVTQGEPGMDVSPHEPGRDRPVGGDRALPRHVRRGAASRDLRQDTARDADGGTAVRPPPHDHGPRRTDADRHSQPREGGGEGALSPRERSAGTKCSPSNVPPITASGTCTFYGTANSNQLLAEVMGLNLPGASFVNPGTPLREAVTRAAARRITGATAGRRLHAPRPGR